MVLKVLDIHMPKNVVGPLPHILHKINSKWIEDLDKRANTIKLIGANVGVNLYNLGFGSGFFGVTKSMNSMTTKA